jgi:hypothetical protein
MKQSFILHLDSLKILDLLTDEQVAILIRAIYYYQLNGELPLNLDLTINLIIQPFINQFERDNIKYNNIVKRNVENGKKGGRGVNQSQKQVIPKEPNGLFGNPKEATGYFGNPKEPKQADSDSGSGSGSGSDSGNDNDNDSDSDSDSGNGNGKDNKKEKKRKEFNEFLESLPDVNWSNLLNIWLEYKKERREAYKSVSSIKVFCRNLIGLSNGEYLLAEKIINQSIGNNYAGIFTIKNNQNGKSTNTAEAEQAEFRRVAEMLRRTVSNNSRPS